MSDHESWELDPQRAEPCRYCGSPGHSMQWCHWLPASTNAWGAYRENNESKETK